MQRRIETRQCRRETRQCRREIRRRIIGLYFSATVGKTLGVLWGLYGGRGGGGDCRTHHGVSYQGYIACRLARPRGVRIRVDSDMGM